MEIPIPMPTIAAPHTANKSKQDSRCFEHRHMRFDEYGLYCYAKTVSNKSGIFYFDGRSVADCFSGHTKTAAYRVFNNLVEKGWFEVIKKGGRNDSGEYEATQVRVLAHAEWAINHTDECPVSVSGHNYIY